MKSSRAVLLFGLAYALLLAFLAVIRARCFQVVFGPDFGFFTQLAWSIAHGHGFHQTVLQHELSTLLELTHFIPGLALLAPLQWVWPGPESMAAAQAAIWGSAFIPIHRIVARHTRRDAWGWAAALLFAISPLAVRMALADFRLSIVAAALLIWMLERLQARRPGAAAILAVLACSLREDVVPSLVLLGPLALWLMPGRRSLRDAAWCLGLPLLTGGLWSSMNSTLRGTMSRFLSPEVLLRAGSVLDMLPNLQHDQAAFLRPLPLSALLAPEALIPALPNLAGSYWLYASGHLMDLDVNDTCLHYVAIAPPLMALAAALGAARLLRWLRLDGRRARAVALGLLALGTLATLPPHGPTSGTPWLPAGPMGKLEALTRALPERWAEMRELDARVPPEEAIVATMHQGHLYADRYQAYWYNIADVPRYTRRWRAEATTALLEPRESAELLALDEGWVECWSSTRLILLRRSLGEPGAEDPCAFRNR
jgi:hypothetical protein